MIPKNENAILQDLKSLEFMKEPSRTYRLDIEQGRIIGYCDGIKAVMQAVYLILNTERFDWVIYSWNYGVELKELYGKQIELVVPEFERFIQEALKQDDRIKDVINFTHTIKDKKLRSTFEIISVVGVFESGWEVDF